LFRNRVSDLCWWVQLGWDLLGIVLQWGVVLAAIWYTLTDNLSISVHTWWVVVIYFFFLITTVLFALICRLITGRVPGQARKTRKTIAKYRSDGMPVVTDN